MGVQGRKTEARRERFMEGREKLWSGREACEDEGE